MSSVPSTSSNGFPEGFMWGSCSSSLQTEGASPSSDWFAWEQAGRMPRSGDGNGFGSDFAEDFAQLASLGLVHHRLSLDWARLEPGPGRHDMDAVERYREVLSAAGDAGISVWACLHDFVLPGWFSEDQRGFFERSGRSLVWPRHVDWVAETFGDLIHGWVPMNEPVTWSMRGWLLGDIPPGRSDVARCAEALECALLAQHEAWRVLRSGAQPTMTSHALMPVRAVWPEDDPRQKVAALDSARQIDELVWSSWIRAMSEGVLQVPGRALIEVPDMAESFDLIGFSYIGALGVGAEMDLGARSDGNHATAHADALAGPLGSEPWAEGLRLCQDRLAHELAGRPIVIASCGLGTETDSATGTGTDGDERRCEYLTDCMQITSEAITDGIDVRGFFHRTGIDGYELGAGFDVASGLIRRDRTPKASADVARHWASGT